MKGHRSFFDCNLFTDCDKTNPPTTADLEQYASDARCGDNPDNCDTYCKMELNQACVRVSVNSSIRLRLTTC